MVRMGGLEPPRAFAQRILSPLRLPIPPHPHSYNPINCETRQSKKNLPYTSALYIYFV